MIHRERVADDVYTFQSDVYAQVNAGAVIGQDWAVVIDTLAFPDETLAIREFIEDDLNRKVRYVINTHYHAIIIYSDGYGYSFSTNADRTASSDPGHRCHGINCGG